LLGVLAVVLVTAVPALAEQPERDPQQLEQVRQRFEEVKDRLALTPAQAERVEPVIAGMILVMNDVREDRGVEDRCGPRRRRMNQELRAIRAYAQARLKPVLSWTQRAELRAILAAWDDELGRGTLLAAK
jgi:septal ring factor EnvC (AmiA/AmiB activator)